SFVLLLFVFFFQAEDGIRDFHVTGVQTRALPISLDYYFRQCALRVTCVDLARMGLFLAAPPGSPAPVCRELIRMVNAFMFTCGKIGRASCRERVEASVSGDGGERTG